MAKDSFIDFAAIKDAVSFARAIEYLGLKLTRHGDQLRGECPTCDTTNPRALVITPDKGYYCFGEKRGGDVVGLVAHCKGLNQRDAAKLLQDAFMREPEQPKQAKQARKPTSRQKKVVQPVTPVGGSEDLDQWEAFIGRL